MEEEKGDMPGYGAGDFWEQWNPQLTEGSSINFLGDVHLQLDLTDNDARVASLFFDTMVFKGSSENLDDDPILQSILQQQRGRMEVIDAGTNNSSDLPMDQEVASSSKAPLGETIEQDEVDDAAAQGPVNAEAADSEATAIRQGVRLVDEVNAVNKENMKRRGTANFNAVSFTNKLMVSMPLPHSFSFKRSSLIVAKDHFRDKPEVHDEFFDILRNYQREQKPIQTIYDQVTTLLSSAPDLCEDFKHFLLETTRQTKQDDNSTDDDSDLRVEIGNGDHNPVNDDGNSVHASVPSPQMDETRLNEDLDSFIENPISRAESDVAAGEEATNYVPDYCVPTTAMYPESLPTLDSDAGAEIRDENDAPVHDVGNPAREKANHNEEDDGTDSAGETTQPPGAPLMGSMSPMTEKEDSPTPGKKRTSSVYVNGHKVLDLTRRRRPLTKRQPALSSLHNAPSGSSFGQIPPTPGATLDNQGSSASAPQPSDSQAHQHDLGSASIPQATAGDAIAAPTPFDLDDPFEADVEDELSRPRAPRRKARTSGIYIDGEKVQNLNHRNCAGGSRPERIVIVDSPAVPRTPPPSWTTSEMAPNPGLYDSTHRRPVIVDERGRVHIEIVDNPRPRRHRHTSDVPRSAYSLDERSTHPRHASDISRSTRSLNETEEEYRRQKRREQKRRRDQEERLRARIAEANAEINSRPRPAVAPKPLRRSPSYYRPSVEGPDREAEIAEAMRRFREERREEEALRPARKEERKGKEKEGEENTYYSPLVDPPEDEVEPMSFEEKRRDEEARRLARREERERKEKEDEEGKSRASSTSMDPSARVPDTVGELEEALNQLDKKEEQKARQRAREEKKKREEEDDEAQRRRLMERMQPRRRESTGPGSRRSRVLYDEGIYRWE
ncbi:hypothetical protein ACHAPT_010964 [Fusarium lateritium]